MNLITTQIPAVTGKVSILETCPPTRIFGTPSRHKIVHAVNQHIVNLSLKEILQPFCTRQQRAIMADCGVLIVVFPGLFSQQKSSRNGI